MKQKWCRDNPCRLVTIPSDADAVRIHVINEAEERLYFQRASRNQNLHDVAYGQGRFVAVGNAGTIVQSEAALPSFSAPGVSGGAFPFTLNGGIEESYTVQRSDNLLSWTNTTVFTNNGVSVSFLTARAPPAASIAR